ncbi:sigma-70 family RNA polymerase sigma factor [Curtobacterium sp. SGAir0571]|uniref:RNA polymerase sigma factor n=1 Tax=Curtobacterium sp. SGAir0471 TaxID=2070337 RepID=UPI0010F6717C|nr:sigma-70 family RNA polymerase sigma factor [Curtobacterium sp. SGAir0471]
MTRPPGTGDAALLAAIATGDRGALATAFDHHAPTLTRYAWALADDRAGVAALVQDSFASLWQQAGTIAVDEVGLLPWLLVTCRDHWAASTSTDRHRDPADAQHRLRFVLDEVAALGPVARQVVEACIVGGRSFAEAVRTPPLPLPRITGPSRRSAADPRKAVDDREH